VQKHHLGDKTIADVCEAVIGAALVSYKDTGDMDMAVKAVTALVSNGDHAVSRKAKVSIGSAYCVAARSCTAN